MSDESEPQVVEGGGRPEGVDSPKVKAAKARAASLSPEERKAIATAAALERWHGETLRATHEGTLTIGDSELECAVLEDSRRVLSERGVLRAFGQQRGGASFRSATLDTNGGRLPLFLSARNLRPFIDNDLVTVLTQPILYRPLKRRPIGYGLDATLIPRVCEVWLRARDAGVLQPAQRRTAARADVLMRGLANTGIIALVDEATGYQEVRDRLALQALLDAYLNREFAAWAKRFPDEFYHEIFRLRGWTWDALRQKAGKGLGPRVIGKYTNDIVYSRLAPGILEELQRINPPNEAGKRRAKHHQFFTEEVGHPALAQHVSNVMALQRASSSWEEFMRLVNRAMPRKTNLQDLPLFGGVAPSEK